MLIPFVINCENPNVTRNDELYIIDDKIHLSCGGLWKNEKHWSLDKHDTPHPSKLTPLTRSCRIPSVGSLSSASGTCT